MRINKHSLRHSIHALLTGTTPSRAAADQDERMEDIRETMLNHLRDAERDYPQVLRRVRHAVDIQNLWYLRGDAMAALSALYGEADARHRIAEITLMFHGLLPRGLRPRTTSLTSALDS